MTNNRRNNQTNGAVESHRNVRNSTCRSASTSLGPANAISKQVTDGKNQLETIFSKCLQKVWQYLRKAGAAGYWNLKCVFSPFLLIGHSCQNTFYTLHDAFMSFLSMDSNESFSFSISIHKLYRNGTVFCLWLCRKCTFSVHFCAFFVQTASSLQAPRLGFSLRNEARCLHCTTCSCLEQPYRNI